ncbi:small-conductance mechanosensitive channel [Bacteroides pyogenes JCM 6292]|uniref:Small-conductance mechanosensitive channel n=1 Tax=Bacteroides pyogenes JCM 6292 TaxID=1235809 RepID=W4P8G3_9BACE|nr:small-conductance mechanosensitive channel [Bacteroides pyogenes JCM 6292]
MHALAESSVNVIARVWVKSSDYWDVYFTINKRIYQTFNEKGVNFPFPQLTVHQADSHALSFFAFLRKSACPAFPLFLAY